MKLPKPTDQQIIDVCKSSLSMSRAIAALGMNKTTFKKRAMALGVYSPNQSGKGMIKPSPSNTIPLDEILDGKHPHYQTNKLKQRLYSSGIKQKKCEMCGIEEWNGKEIVLQLDHIDGNSHNHLLNNLRVLCPNCHSQTETWCFKL